MEASDTAIDQRVVKALAHPVRMQILALLNEKVASPRELADDLAQPLGTVSYHVRTLVDLDFIELVRTEPRRGAVEHFYRALERPFFRDEDFARLPASARRTVFGTTVGRVWKDLRETMKAGGLEDTETHVSRTPLVLDRQGREDMTALLLETLERAAEIQEEVAERTASAPEGKTTNTSLVLMHFEGTADEPRRRG